MDDDTGKLCSKYQDYFHVLDLDPHNLAQEQTKLDYTLHNQTQSAIHQDQKQYQLDNKYTPTQINMALHTLHNIYHADETQCDPITASTMISNVILLNWYQSQMSIISPTSTLIFTPSYECDDKYLYQSELPGYEKYMKEIGVLECLKAIYTDHDFPNCYKYHDKYYMRRQVKYDYLSNLMNYYPFTCPVEDQDNKQAYAHNAVEVSFHPLFYKTIICKHYKKCGKMHTRKFKPTCKVYHPSYKWDTKEIIHRMFACHHIHEKWEECPFVHEGEQIRTNAQYSFSIMDINWSKQIL